MEQSNIEWAEIARNPATGTKISTGWEFCYAEIMPKRLKAMGIPKYYCHV